VKKCEYFNSRSFARICRALACVFSSLPAASVPPGAGSASLCGSFPHPFGVEEVLFVFFFIESAVNTFEYV